MERSELREAVKRACWESLQLWFDREEDDDLPHEDFQADAVLTVLDQQQEARRAGFLDALTAYDDAIGEEASAYRKAVISGDINGSEWTIFARRNVDKQAARKAVIAAAGFEVTE